MFYSPGRASEEIGLFATVSLGKSSDELCVPLLNISNLLTIYPLDIPKNRYSRHLQLCLRVTWRETARQVRACEKKLQDMHLLSRLKKIMFSGILKKKS
jgi:hypothetical protein